LSLHKCYQRTGLASWSSCCSCGGGGGGSGSSCSAGAVKTALASCYTDWDKKEIGCDGAILACRKVG